MGEIKKIDVLVNDRWEKWTIEEVDEQINFSIRPKLEKANEIRLHYDWLEIVYIGKRGETYSRIYNSVYGTYVMQPH